MSESEIVHVDVQITIGYTIVHITCKNIHTGNVLCCLQLYFYMQSNLIERPPVYIDHPYL